VDALAPLLGAIVGASLEVTEEHLGYLLALYAGFFLYMGATDLLPEAHEHPSRLRVALTVLGFAAVFGLSLVAR
jgi:zinc transporter ZupT